MFTVCPKCTLTLAVTAADLRAGQGYVRCGRCTNVFNALLTLTEAPADPPADLESPPIESQSSTADGTGTFETIVLEGDGFLQTEEFVPEADVKLEIAALNERLDYAARHAPQQQPQPQPPPQPPPPPPPRPRQPAAVADFSDTDVAYEGPAFDTDASADPDADGADEWAVLDVLDEPDALSDPDGDGRILYGSADTHAAPAAAPPAPPAAAGKATTTDTADAPAPARARARARARADDAPSDPDDAGDGLLGYPPAPARRRWLWAGGSALLVLLLGAQAVNHWRNALAAQPRWNRPLTQLYGALGIVLAPQWDLNAYDVRQQGAQADAGLAGTIRVRLSIANHARRAQPLPVLRLTLLDRYGKRIAARDLKPADYLPAGATARTFLAPDQRIDTQVSVQDPTADSTSFELDWCLAAGGGALRCAGDSAATR